VSESPWVATLEEVKLQEGLPTPINPKGVGLLLIKTDGAIYAVRNRCAHMGCPLEGGKLEGFVLTCPCHDWRFDIRSGAYLDAKELSIGTYHVKRKEGKVLVELPEAAS
jgi:3-phenylpropionate/trans-cinnamate dioxygenase ferredoxin subunit